ncbi:MRC1-like domain-containing protein [Aspergillus varians]
MSSPSTPRRTRSASAAADSPDILTPGRKIKAMLAAFDSDSDSESEKPVNKKPTAISTNSPKPNTKPTTHTFTMDSDDEDEDDDIIMPRGRMAARLLGNNTEQNGESTTQPPAESAFERISKTLRAAKQGPDDTRHDSADDGAVSSDDDLPAAGPRRRVQNTEMTRDADGDSVRSQSRARSFSPLFMSSPTKPQNGEQEQRESAALDDEEVAPKRNNRFLELVAKKRKEREEKERIEAEKKAAKAQEREALNSRMFSDEESADDASSGRKKPAQPSRPARKAGKKALEDMSRETQRMSRNMQLAHEARTKKKITKESFFARFNFMQPAEQTTPEQPGENSSTTAESQHSSDIEVQKDKETPQTSPILPPADGPDDSRKEHQEQELSLSTLEELMNAPAEESHKLLAEETEGPATKPSAGLSNVKKGKLPLRVAPVRIRLSREQVARHQKDDSDSDLEIVTSPAKCRRIAAFENLPARNAQEPPSMFKLKALAQLTSPSRKSTMNSAELSASLLYQAKQQAAKERRERIEELRAKGIIIETSAERAAFEDEIENLVEKARQEGEQIAKQERAAAKRENGGDDDDDEDEDFELSGSEDGDQGDVDPEGDVEMEDEDEDENEDEADKEGNLIDSEAGEDEDEDEDDVDESEDEAATKLPLEVTDMPTQRRKRPTRVLSDDEDEEEDQAPKTPTKPINPFLNSVERPNIPVKPSEATMSLTQAFAGTLAPSQDMSQKGTSTIPLTLPEPVPMSPHRVPDSQVIIKDSQEQRAESTDPFPGYWQPNARVSESPAHRSISQMSQIPDPTQDAGFVLSPFDPHKRFLGTPTSTIETVLVERDHSPVAARNRNLRRGKAPEFSAIEEQDEGDFEIDASAFDVMKTAAKKTRKQNDLFDRNKSKAKDVVEEAAEESDDEYAGLGGGSDDDADDEENALDREMINDNSGERVDAKQLAALNALHQRNADEKDVAKLMKDITTGALRRRRGADDELDLDDSDDELLARRRQKQREFARMRNALLADEKIGEIAENPKKAAFFKAIEDRDDDDDAGLSFLGYEQEGGASQDDPSSQDGGAEAQTDLPEGESNKRKRPLEPTVEDINKRPPPHLRRKPAGAMSKKPATLAEIRETVSFLTERHEYESFQEEASLEEDEDEQHVNEDEPEEPSVTSREREASVACFSHPRRTRGPVVDRLALLRQASSNSATSASSNTRFAFHTGAGGDKATSFGFKPPMLRKTSTAASSSSSTSDSSRGGVTRAPGASIAKKGSVNYYTAAREREREKQLRTQHRDRGSNITALLNKHAGNRLGSFGGTGQWD